MAYKQKLYRRSCARRIQPPGSSNLQAGISVVTITDLHTCSLCKLAFCATVRRQRCTWPECVTLEVCKLVNVRSLKSVQEFKHVRLLNMYTHRKTSHMFDKYKPALLHIYNVCQGRCLRLSAIVRTLIFAHPCTRRTRTYTYHIVVFV